MTAAHARLQVEVDRQVARFESSETWHGGRPWCSGCCVQQATDGDLCDGCRANPLSWDCASILAAHE